MTIPWIKCSERMPPDDVHIIIRKVGEDKLSLYKSSVMKAWLRNKNAYEWIPYTKETWRKLNDTRN